MLFVVPMYSQTADSIKVLNIYENISAYYDKLNTSVIINSVPENTKITIEIFDITGLSIIKNDYLAYNKQIDMPLWLKSGIYIIIIGNKHFSVTRKIRVN